MNPANLSYVKSIFSLSILAVSCMVFSTFALGLSQSVNTQTTEQGIATNKKKALQYQVKFIAHKNYDFLLTADYRFFPEKASAKHMPGVIILHDCESNRNSYKTLSSTVANLGIHTLSLDFRGYGNSINEAYSYKKLKKESHSIVDFQSEKARLMSYWSSDLLAAYEYLRSKVDKSQSISVVSSGCSSSYAVGLAEKVYLKSLVLITPEMNYGDKERYKNLVDIPSYFISSAQHATTYATAQELFTWNGDKHSKMQIYKGDKINYGIIRANADLVNDIALWLKSTLR